jgi:orotate phosphoribosyltransferase-like protein
VPQYSRREREQLSAVAVDLRAQGLTYAPIAEELGINRETARKWLEDEYAKRGEHDSVSIARERAIAGYELLIREGWKRLEKLDDGSHNVPGILNAICRAQARVDKLTGAEASVKYLIGPEVPEHDIVITWGDLDNPELFE